MSLGHFIPFRVFSVLAIQSSAALASTHPLNNGCFKLWNSFNCLSISLLMLVLVLVLGAIPITSTNTDAGVCGIVGEACAMKNYISSIICIIIFIICICIIIVESSACIFSALSVLPSIGVVVSRILVSLAVLTNHLLFQASFKPYL